MSDQPRDEDLSPLARAMKAEELAGFVRQLQQMVVYSPSPEWSHDAEAMIEKFKLQIAALRSTSAPSPPAGKVGG